MPISSPHIFSWQNLMMPSWGLVKLWLQDQLKDQDINGNLGQNKAAAAEDILICVFVPATSRNISTLDHYQ